MYTICYDILYIYMIDNYILSTIYFNSGLEFGNGLWAIKASSFDPQGKGAEKSVGGLHLTGSKDSK